MEFDIKGRTYVVRELDPDDPDDFDIIDDMFRYHKRLQKLENEQQDVAGLTQEIAEKYIPKLVTSPVIDPDAMGFRDYLVLEPVLKYLAEVINEVAHEQKKK